MSERTPLQSLLFLLAVGSLAIITMWAFPKKGIAITDSITLEYESLHAFFGSNDSLVVSVEDSLFGIVGIDTVALRDSLDRVTKLRHERVTSIQHADSTVNSLAKFYKSLLKLKAKGGKIRVMHYGDSQIEADRMTRYIRNELQKEYGGTGPGFEPAFQVIRTGAVRQDQSDNWLRYTANGKKDSTITHRNYGLLASFSRFCPPADSVARTDTLSAWLEIKPASYGYYRVRKFSQMSILVGGNTQPVRIAISVDSAVVHTEVLAANTFNRKIKVKFKPTPGVIKIKFKGLDSPNVYALSFESGSGVIVDNIPLRGASGTLFRRISSTQLGKQYAAEPIRLVILQFGGNSVPYIDTKERAKKFGNYLKSNIRYLQSLLPKASFVLIGPSDMATKVKGDFVTYPMLETIRNEVQKAAFERGVAYYDMYEVMGGENSMKDWVTADPPLAGGDYVHFTTKGANKMSKLFYDALLKDFDKYRGIPLDTLQTDSLRNEN
ncbi:MAG: GDSL-type esterase/lipase family protein [Cyclobacteriaceae bacterium]|nr:GDSL-type esterase/lipase family protein [Cyclobacteriaceae bacterium]